MAPRSHFDLGTVGAPAARKALALTALLALGDLASADDWWVDARFGDDSRSGAHVSLAWRTISYGLATIPADGKRHTLHVAPGTYSAATGESFPIVLRSDVALVSEEGPARTFVVGDPTESVLEHGALAAEPLEVQGLDVSGGSTGILLDGGYVDTVEHVLASLVVHGCGVGISIDSTNSDLRLRIEDCTFRDNRAQGLDAFANGESFPSTVEAEVVDCEFLRNGAGGLELLVCGHTTYEVSFERCRIESNAGWGLLLLEQLCGAPVGDYTVALSDSLVTGNLLGGLEAVDSFDGNTIDVRRSTIAGNGGFGIRVDLGAISVRDTILWDNGDDVDGPVTLAYCDVEDGDGAGTDGNVSVDPLFAAGGHRLSAGSPVIDLADPAWGPGGIDLDVDPRRLDGDGDGVARLDMGADEHDLVGLQVLGDGQLGSSLTATPSGPSGWAYQLWLSGSTDDVPLGPFGSALLSPSGSVVAATGTLPDVVILAVPRNVALAGTSLHAQVLAVAPAGLPGSTSARVTRTLGIGRAPISPTR